MPQTLWEPRTQSNRSPAVCAESIERAWTVLLIQDCPDDQRRLLHLLCSAGAEVTLECNVKAALDRAAAGNGEASQFDLIVADLHVPFPDGVELAHNLRIKGILAPIVMVGRIADPILQERSLAAGCDCVLQSSIEEAQLIERLVSLVGPARQP